MGSYFCKEQKLSSDDFLDKLETFEEEAHKQNIESEKFYEKLKKEGHTCISKPEIYPMKIEWCGQSQCKNNEKKPTN